MGETSVWLQFSWRCLYVRRSARRLSQLLARIAELLLSPRKRSRVTELCRGKTDEKGMFEDGRRAETGMIGRQMAMSCRGAMQRLEMCVDRRL